MKSVTGWQYDLRQMIVMVAIFAASMGIGRGFGVAWGICLFFYSTAALQSVVNWSRFANSFTVWQGVAFLILWMMFSVLTSLMISRGHDGARPRPLVALGFGPMCVSGPFTGAIARPLPTRVEFGIETMPYAATGIGLALFLHATTPIMARGVDALRFIVWTVGVLAWFCSAIASLMFAF